MTDLTPRDWQTLTTLGCWVVSVVGVYIVGLWVSVYVDQRWWHEGRHYMADDYKYTLIWPIMMPIALTVEFFTTTQRFWIPMGNFFTAIGQFIKRCWHGFWFWPQKVAWNNIPRESRHG